MAKVGLPKGYKFSRDVIEKRAEKLRGKKRSDEFKRRNSERMKQFYEENPPNKFLAFEDRITKEKLIEEYVEKGVSAKKAAEALGCSSTTVLRYLRWYGLPIRESLRTAPWRLDRSENYTRIAYDYLGIERVCILCGSADRVHIHHIDGDRTHNTKENIMTLCVSCHTYVHWKKAKEEGRNHL